MDIAIVGTGYVGLTTGACLASMGHSVRCVDNDAGKIERLRRGDVPIFEVGLDDLVLATQHAGKLCFTANLAEGIRQAEIVFICVGTPTKDDGCVDLSFVEKAIDEIAPFIANSSVVVLKSTVPAGSARMIKARLARHDRYNPVASNPEFLREGSAVSDFFNPDRIIVGADEGAAAQTLSRLYGSFAARGVPVLTTSTVNAELCKYASNAFLALKIGFINEVADLCEQVDGDISEVSACVGHDKRIGGSFLSPGPGFGGSCFPKDARALVALGRRLGANQTLVERLVHSNEQRKKRLAHRILQELDKPSVSTVAILGTAFKAGTDDMREAAALTILPILLERGITIKAHDPQCSHTGAKLLPDVLWRDDPYAAVANADAAVVLTEPDYHSLDLRRVASLMRGDLLFDFRNHLNGDKVLAAGLRHLGIGRPCRLPSAPKGATAGDWRDIAAAPY